MNGAANPPRIALLPDSLISQIAAGEVIERPASIVKELCENALDAGATQLSVRLEGGGAQRIVVQDNGRGMTADDLPLAVMRHATSKVASWDDLQTVASYGFRGEALAATASVSHLKIISRSRTCTHANSLDNQSGDWQAAPSAGEQGTSIEVRDLFFRVPARKKFLRSSATELAHCQEAFERICLANPALQAALWSEGKLLQHFAPSDWQTRAQAVLGNALGAAPLVINAAQAQLAVRGLAARPTECKSRAEQYLYINGRAVKDRSLAHAIRSCYADVLHGQAQPSYAIFIELPPEWVDVNVHPAKSEVRFRDAGALYGLLRQVLGAAITQGSAVNIVNNASLNTAAQSLQSTTTHATQNAFELPPAANAAPRFNGDYRGLVQGTPAWEVRAPEAQFQYAPSVKKPSAVENASPTRFGQALGQLHGVYILAQTNKGLAVIDTHAAHERVLYERFKQQLDEQTVNSQALLAPLPVHVGQTLANVAQENSARLSELGFDIARLSPESLAVRAAPALLLSAQLEPTLTAILEELQSLNTAQAAQQNQYDRLAGKACRAAVKANQVLSMAEMQALLNDMNITPNIDQCNHGRPTWLEFSLKDFDRMFLRGR